MLAQQATVFGLLVKYLLPVLSQDLQQRVAQRPVPHTVTSLAGNGKHVPDTLGATILWRYPQRSGCMLSSSRPLALLCHAAKGAAALAGAHPRARPCPRPALVAGAQAAAQLTVADNLACIQRDGQPEAVGSFPSVRVASISGHRHHSQAIAGAQLAQAIGAETARLA